MFFIYKINNLTKESKYFIFIEIFINFLLLKKI